VYNDFPKLKDDWKVPNPKDIVHSAKANMAEVNWQMTARYFEMSQAMLDETYVDTVEALSVPVFLLEQSIEAIGQVKEISKKQEEIEHERKSNAIVAIIQGVLLIVPFIGEALSVAGLSGIAAAITALDIGANAALLTYEIVKDPSSAPTEILAVLLSAAGLRGRAVKLAKLRKNIDADKMGKVYKKHDVSLQNIMKKCRKKV
jgi:chitinase